MALFGWPYSEPKNNRAGFVISVFYSNREAFLCCLKHLFFDYGGFKGHIGLHIALQGRDNAVTEQPMN